MGTTEDRETPPTEQREPASEELQKIEHLNALLRAVRTVNQLITRERDRDRLLQGACACLVETRGYHRAEIALLDDSGRLVATAKAGAVDEHGDQSKRSVQLAHGERVYGLLTVSVPKDLVTDDEEQGLFEEVAGDIAFALHGIEQAEWRAQAEEALKESLQTSADIVRAMPSGFFTYQYEPPGRLVLLDSNPEAERLTGIRAEEWRGKEFDEIWPQARQSGMTAVFLRVMETGETFETEDLYYQDERFEGAYRIRAFPMPGRRLGVAFEDAIQRKQAEEALARERNLLRILIDSLPDNIYVKDTQGRFLLNNATSMRLQGVRTQEEILGKTDADFMPAERAARYHALEQAFLQAGKPVIDQEVFRPERQSRQWVSSTMVPLRDAQGELIGFVGVGRNITVHKRAEEALRESEERYRTLFADVPVGLYRTTPDGRILDINPALLEMLGYPDREAALTVNATDVYANPADRARWQAMMDREGMVHGFEAQWRRLDGMAIWVKDTARVIRDVEGQVLYYQGAVEDITERRRAEEALREREATLRSILRATPTGIGVVTDRVFGWTNERFQKMLGYAADELGGHSARMIYPSDAEYERVGREKYAEIRDQGVGTIETRFQRKDGSIIDVLLSSSPIDPGDLSAGVTFAALDITERKKAQEALARRMEQLATLNLASQAVTASLELDQVLAEIVSLTVEVAGSDYASVMLVQNGEIRQGFGDLPGVPSTGHQVRDRGFTDWIVHTRQPVLIDDVDGNGRVASTLPAGAPGTINPVVVAAGIRSVAGLPLVARDRMLGVLYLHSTRPSAFRGQLELLSTFANQAAIAIENARLYQETVRRLSEAQAHSRVTVALNRTLNLEQVLQSIVDAATDLVPASGSGVIHLLDEDSGHLVPRATSQNIAAVAQLEMTVGEGIAGLAVQEKRTVNVPDVQREDRFLVVEGVHTPRSLLTAPLLIDQDCIGTLSLNSDRADAFDADDERLLATLAAQAAIAVRSARLHREVQRRVEELTFLNRVGRTVVSSLDLEHILETVMEETSHVLRTEASSVLLLDRESGDLAFEAAVGPGSAQAKGLRLPVGQGIAGWVAREAQPLLVPDVRADPRFSPLADEVTGFVTRSALAVPLQVKGQVIGVIEAVNKTEGAFSEADLALLSSMAQSAAIAIDNARLYADLQARMKELERTQNQLIQSAKLAAVGELAAGVAHEVNNPLTSIIGFTSLILQDMHDADPLKADLEVIEREAFRCKSIVRGLLDFARQTKPQIVPTDVVEVLQSTVALVRHQAVKAGVTIQETFDETLPPVPLDVDQIKQVFLNLMTNGIQAMPGGGDMRIVTRLRGEPALDGKETSRLVAIEFHDTGVGIPEQHLHRIFDPFFTTKETGEGTGLGLSISQSIVEKHGGRIEVASREGRGSVFIVLLPLPHTMAGAPMAEGQPAASVRGERTT